MSTSLLYHAFRVRDYGYVRTKYIAGGVVFTIERKPETYRCVACGSQDVGRQGIVTRSFRSLPIGNTPVKLEARIPRLACRKCGVVRQNLPLTAPIQNRRVCGTIARLPGEGRGVRG